MMKSYISTLMPIYKESNKYVKVLLPLESFNTLFNDKHEWNWSIQLNDACDVKSTINIQRPTLCELIQLEECQSIISSYTNGKVKGLVDLR